MYDVQQLLKRFGVFIYTGDRLGDLQLMDIELNELMESNLIDQQQFTASKLVLRHEINRMKKDKKL